MDTDPITGPGETTRTLSLKRSNLRLCALGVFYIVYLVVGAAVFAAIEGPGETEMIEQIRDVRAAFLEKHQQCTGFTGEYSSAELSDFELEWVRLATNGTNPELFQIIFWQAKMY